MPLRLSEFLRSKKLTSTFKCKAYFSSIIHGSVRYFLSCLSSFLYWIFETKAIIWLFILHNCQPLVFWSLNMKLSCSTTFLQVAIVAFCNNLAESGFQASLLVCFSQHVSSTIFLYNCMMLTKASSPQENR